MMNTGASLKKMRGGGRKFGTTTSSSINNNNDNINNSAGTEGKKFALFLFNLMLLLWVCHTRPCHSFIFITPQHQQHRRILMKNRLDSRSSSCLNNNNNNNNDNNNNDNININNFDDYRNELKEIATKQTQNAVVDALFSSSSSTSVSSSSSSTTTTLTPLQLVGQARISLNTSNNNNNTSSNQNKIVTLVLSNQKQKQRRSSRSSTSSISSLLVPLDSINQLKLISFAAAKRQLSKSVLLTLNPLLVNRDNGIFDNLPWSSWTVDPQQRNRDAAKNFINPKFHLGKRDAYNRFMGKDWQGRSLAIGNMALRLKYMLESDNNNNNNNDDDDNNNNNSKNDNNDQQQQQQQQQENNTKELAIRILQLRQRELRMDLADIESQLAVARTNSNNNNNNDDDERLLLLSSLEERQIQYQQLLIDIEQEIDDLTNIIIKEEEEEEEGTESSSSSKKVVESMISDVLNRIADWTTDDGQNAAPYRGAMGYAPMLDSKEDIDERSLLPYTSPYDLLNEIIDEQLNAKVIGCVLENTSLLTGTTALGGAIVLQRKTPTKTVTLVGEQVKYNDYEEDYGNEIVGGETMIVECDPDEAIGVALACGITIKVESNIYDRSSILAEPSADSAKQQQQQQQQLDEESEDESKTDRKHIIDVLSMWKPSDPSMSFEVEGDRSTSSNPSPISIPRTTTSLFDSIFDDTNKPKDSSMFPTDNPIKSLNQLDGLSNEKKAKTLLEMSNFNGRLPRPRVVRNSAENPLDQLLLPLIDESVRRQYTIRDAERNGDTQLVQELKQKESRYQKARQQAEAAKDMGDTDTTNQWESEAEFLASLRADVTQDEGSYSRFLDRDDWYERERRATAKRVNKSSFGNLLDGIE